VGTTTKPSGNWSNTTSGSFYYNRTVTLSPYRIGKYEVTYELWKMVYDWAVSDARGAGVYTFTNQGTKGQQGTSTSEYAGIENDETGYPVARVAWYDAAVWCNALTEMTLGPEHCVYRTNEGAIIRSAGEHDASNPLSNPLNSVVYLDNNREYLYTGYRLPTSAEWEFAARGGDPSDTTNWNYLYAGSDTASDVAVYNDSQTTQTAKVGTKTPNRLGLYDMGGNVWEWVRDSNIGTPDVGTGHTVAVTVKNPEDCGTEPKLASVRRRGGSYRDSDGGAKNTQHGTTNKDTFNSMGLRIARTVGETQ
jgi:formylglycine-generating enzyme required for sulfatase activity